MMTKGYLLDTNILSYLLLGLNNHDSPLAKNVLQHYLEHVKDSNMFICSATTGEIEYGLKSAPSPDGPQQKEVRDVLEKFPVVFNLDKHVAGNEYSSLRADIFKKYANKDKKKRAKDRYIEEWCDPTTGKSLGINENDVWIAAVAIAHNLRLVTADKMSHILSVAPAGFEILDWTIAYE